MKLSKGMYVRTKKGIFRIRKKDVFIENKKQYIGVNGRYTCIDIETIEKASHNITELLEPADLMYIDISPDNYGGIVVPRVAETQNELDKWKQRFASGECILKGVLTKEQIVSNWYLDE